MSTILEFVVDWILHDLTHDNQHFDLLSLKTPSMSMRKRNLNVNVAAILKNVGILGGNRAFPKEWASESICTKFHACITNERFI